MDKLWWSGRRHAFNMLLMIGVVLVACVDARGSKHKEWASSWKQSWKNKWTKLHSHFDPHGWAKQWAHDWRKANRHTKSKRGKPKAKPCKNFKNIRLTEGAYGILEIQHEGDWLGMCEDEMGFSVNAAIVVCRQLGMEGGAVYPIQIENDAYVGAATTSQLHKVRCRGGERSLDRCARHNPNNRFCKNLVQLACAPAFLQENKKTRTLTKQLSNERQKILELEKQIQSAKTSKDKLSEDVVKGRRRIQELQLNLQAEKDAQYAQSNSFWDIQKQISECTDALQSKTDALLECADAASQPKDKDKRKIRELQLELQAEKDAKHANSMRISDIEKEISECTEAFKSSNESNQVFVRSLSEEILKAKARVSSIERQLSECRKAFKSSEKSNQLRINSMSEQILEAEASKTNLQAEIAALREDRIECENAEKSWLDVYCPFVDASSNHSSQCSTNSSAEPASVGDVGNSVVRGSDEQHWFAYWMMFLFVLVSFAGLFWFYRRFNVFRNTFKLSEESSSDLKPQSRDLITVHGVVGRLGPDFSHIIYDEPVGEETARLIKIQCPGIELASVCIEVIFNGCIISLERSESRGVEGVLWTKQFQFDPTDGLFELQEDQVQLENGVLQVVFKSHSFQKRVLRFPRHYSLSCTDLDQCWDACVAAGDEEALSASSSEATSDGFEMLPDPSVD